jgi:tripartite-type tricarboxylate transporter receptor subunit TctC
MQEFIALLKANPKKYNYGSSGNGTAVHLASELFKKLAGVDIQHVPYKGNSEALQDLLGGRIDMLLDGVPPEASNIAAGRLRALGVTTTERTSSLPDVPTIAEAGVKGYAFPYWTAIYAPAKTPKPILDKLASAVAAAAHDPVTRKRFADAGADVVGSTPEELDRFWKQQFAMYEDIVKTTGIKLDGD